MVANNNLNVIPFYSGKEYWHSNQWYSFGQVFPVAMLTNKSIPFQFVLPSYDSNVQSVTIRDVENSVPLRQLTSNVVRDAANQFSIVKCAEQSINPLPFGSYYYSVSLTDGAEYVSDIVRIIDNESQYIRIEYWNEENLYYNGGAIDYSDRFKFVAYVKSIIGKPEYEFEEEITKRLGYKFIESQISNKVYKFNFPATESFCDALRLVRMSDYIKLTTSLDTYNALYLSYEISWEGDGNIANVEVQFETDTIIQKLESFNRTQTANFYNALLPAIDEPIMFDESVVAQYYQEFENTGTILGGKLIRQLTEANEEEIKANEAFLVVDLGAGEAKKIKLSLISKLFGSSFFELDDNGNVRVKDGKNFYTEGEISAGGYSEEGGTEPGGGGGIDETKLWQILGTPGTQQIDASHLQDALSQFTPDLSDYATLDALNTHALDTNLHLSEEDREKLSWFAKDEQGNIYIKGGLNFYTEGEISAGGYSDEGGTEPGGGTGIDETKLWQILGNSGTEQIAKNHLTTALSDYITASSANSLFATKTELSNYATLSDLAKTNSNVTAISTKLDDFLEGSDTDTIINKWKELEAFLSGMSESDNLADILAIKADTTWVTEQLSTKLDKTVFDDLFEKVLISEGKYAIRAKYDFFSEGEISAGGYSDEGGGTGVGSLLGIKVNGSTYEPVDGYITIPDYPTELAWGAITGKPTTLAGYGITDAYTEAESDSMFVIKSGDVMVGTLTIQYGGDYKLVFNNTDGERLSVIDFRENGTSYGYLSMGSTSLSINCPNNLITVGGHTILHTGNYTSTLDTRYVKKSGDTMTGALNIMSLSLANGNEINSSDRLYLGYRDTPQGVNVCYNNLPFTYGSGNYTIWHAGNDGAGSGLDADLLGGIEGKQYLKTYGYNYYTTTNKALSSINAVNASEYAWNNFHNCAIQLINNNNALSIIIGGTTNDRNANIQVGHSDNTNYANVLGNLYLNKLGGGVYIGTTLAATINSNVASATKLQTARTIWGQSFNGTDNVDGCLRIQANEENYSEGIRIKPYNNWSTIVLGGNDLTSNVGTSANSWSIHNNNGNFWINRYGSNLNTGYQLCNVNGNWGFGTTSPGFKVDVVGSVRCQGEWFRTTGNTGWYSETYGGGIYMTDTTYVRVYNNKQFYCNRLIAGNPFTVFDIGGYGWNEGAAAYNVKIYNNRNQTPLILGYRNDISDTGSNRVFAMELLNYGTEVRFNLSSFTKLTVHSSGITVIGNIVATGEISAGSSSDARLKNILGKHDYAKRLLDLGMVVDYEYNDLAFSRNVRSIERRRYTGLIYQNVKDVLPQMAGEDEDGYGYLNYIHTDYINLIAGALQQTILKQETIEQRVERLERENAELKQKIAKLAT